MLLDFPSLCARHLPKVSTVIHLGAHVGEELEVYDSLGIANVHWVEGDNAACIALRERIALRKQHHIHQAWIADFCGRITKIYRASNSQSTSLAEPDLHLIEHPDVTFTEENGDFQVQTLDHLLSSAELSPDECNVLVMDLQGVEMAAMRGGLSTLRRMQAVYTEVNIRSIYAGCVILPDMDKWMLDRGFMRLDTYITQHGWGDAFYRRI